MSEKKTKTSVETRFAYSDTSVNVINYNNDRIHNELLPMVYTVKLSMFGYYLAITGTELPVPPVIFDDKVSYRANKVIHTFLNSTRNSTGVLLSGDKGSGKTMLMNTICNTALKNHGLPIVVIKDAYSGSGFVDFINQLGSCVLVFDEFGKMYNNSDSANQDDLLSLFDGQSSVKRITLMSENKLDQINEFFLDRPGRIHYHFQYGKLSIETVKMVCEANKITEPVTKQIVDIARAQKTFSFDILNAILAEHLLYPSESVIDLIKDMNIGVNADIKVRLKILKIIDVDANEELDVSLNTLYIDKPINFYDESYVQCTLNKTDLENVKKNQKKEYSEFLHNKQSFYLRERDITLEDDEKILFKVKTRGNKELIITAAYANEEKFDYSIYMQ